MTYPFPLVFQPYDVLASQDPFVSYYTPRKLRETLSDLTRDSSGDEETGTTHSKIVGWAYDGNPIYGPRGYANPDGTGGIVYLTPSYSSITGNRDRGPSLSQFPAGTFIEGSTIELSADGPLRPPYVAYMQGGLNYAHIKLVLKGFLQELN